MVQLTNIDRAFDFLDGVTGGDVDRTDRYLTADATWRATRDPDVPAFDRAGILDLVERLKTAFRWFKMTLPREGVTASGNRVALEGEGHGVWSNGEEYTHFYHFLIEFSGEKIRCIREYKVAHI